VPWPAAFTLLDRARSARTILALSRLVAEERISILVVDDEEAIRTLLARVGERAGFAVDTARDGLEALEMLHRKEYLIAIVDLMMPRLSGYELVQRISGLKPRPFVIVATALTNGAIASLDDSMVRRVIRKPFDVHAVAAGLIETARQIVEKRAADASAPAELITVAPAETHSPESVPPPPDDPAT
jgi:DNA-binding response OmpR family regulator